MPRIIVCVKHALDVTELRVDSATRLIIAAGASHKISDFDKNALEEAIRLKEKQGGEVIVVTVSPEDAAMTSRETLAMGADKAYLVNDPSFEKSDTLVTSYILSEVIKKLGEFDLILCGEASVDSYSAQVGPRLAGERSLEDCYETVRAKTPVLLTVTGEINEPRIPSLMAIMKASKKEIVKWNMEDLGIPEEKIGVKGSAIQVTEVLAPKVERRKIVIKGETVEEVAEELAKALIEEGVIGR